MRDLLTPGLIDPGLISATPNGVKDGGDKDFLSEQTTEKWMKNAQFQAWCLGLSVFSQLRNGLSARPRWRVLKLRFYEEDL